MLVPKVGFEPTRGRPRRILSPLRLPFRHFGPRLHQLPVITRPTTGLFGLVTTSLSMCLTIAGSDPGGGAGIQGDLKTFSALGAYGMAVLTALTAQNTREVRDIHLVPPDFISTQLATVLDDLPCHAAKTGMLANAEVIRAVSRELRTRSIPHLIVDPVMVSTSGARLLDENAVESLRQELLPLASLVTPNAQEAAVLAGMEIHTQADAEQAARRIFAMGARAVLIKGGDFAVEEPHVTDLLFDGKEVITWTSHRIRTRNTHGSGCALAAATTVYLARGYPLRKAVEKARYYVFQAIRAALPIGQGHGPINHLHSLGNVTQGK